MQSRRPENKQMEAFLIKNGVKATPWYIWNGSMRGCWRIWGKGQSWTQELREKLTHLGFVDFDNTPLDQFSGNGGQFQVFVRCQNINTLCN